MPAMPSDCSVMVKSAVGRVLKFQEVTKCLWWYMHRLPLSGGRCRTGWRTMSDALGWTNWIDWRFSRCATGKMPFSKE